MSASAPHPPRDTPCLGRCTTPLGDDICRGCGRTFDEVTRWVGMTEDEKRQVWQRLLARGWTPDGL
jgi:predicted Fe-S protein YdhL (DUF1289 family)